MHLFYTGLQMYPEYPLYPNYFAPNTFVAATNTAAMTPMSVPSAAPPRSTFLPVLPPAATISRVPTPSHPYPSWLGSAWQGLMGLGRELFAEERFISRPSGSVFR